MCSGRRRICPGSRTVCLERMLITCRCHVSNDAHHPRVDARLSQKSIPQIHRGFDVKRQLPPPLMYSMTPNTDPNYCSSKNLEWKPVDITCAAMRGGTASAGGVEGKVRVEPLLSLSLSLCPLPSPEPQLHKHRAPHIP